jgi:arylsulfatase A-like enzyme
LAEYDGAIRRGDRYVGKRLDHLDSLGLTDRTIVVFTSDHGEEFLEHGRCFHLTTLYREVLHVPLIVSAPGLEPGRVSRLVPASVSIGATVLSMVGLERHELPGVYLLDPDYDEAEAVVSETSRTKEGGRGDGHLRSLTRPGDKLLHRITDESYERFDLVEDPHETEPQTSGPAVEGMIAALSSWLKGHPSLLGEATEEEQPDADIDRQLKALGYVD